MSTIPFWQNIPRLLHQTVQYPEGWGGNDYPSAFSVPSLDLFPYPLNPFLIRFTRFRAAAPALSGLWKPRVLVAEDITIVEISELWYFRVVREW